VGDFVLDSEGNSLLKWSKPFISEIHMQKN